MRRLSCKVEITRAWSAEEGVMRRWEVRRVAEIRITGDSNMLQDTCTIRLPKNTRWEGYDKIPVRRGDAVRVWMGYDEALSLRFIGYVAEVSAKTPTTLTCEDGIFVLRQRAAKKRSYSRCTVAQLLADQMPEGVRYRISGEIEIGSYRVTATTVAGVLQDLREHYGVTSTMSIEDGEPVLQVWTVYPGLRRMAGVWREGESLISDTLTYRRREDVSVRVHGVSLQADGTRIEYSAGEGEKHDLYRYGLTMAQLQEVVQNEIERLKWEGLSGSFVTFGAPQVDKTDVVELWMSHVPRGRYQVQGVNVSFGFGGYRQTVTLGRKITEE